MKKGVIIVLAGSDGSGKSTQYQLLSDRAQREGFSTKYMKYPDESNPVGKFTRTHYLGGKLGALEDLNPKASACFYALDRHFSAPKLLKWKDEGFNVILDRYFESNLAYQGGRGRTNEEKQSIMDFIWDLEINHLGIPEPDLTIYLDLPPQESVKASKERVSNEGSDEGDIFDHNVEAQNDTRFVYNWLLKKYENHPTTPWVKINCLDENNNRISIPDLHEIIWNTVVPKLVK